MSTNLLEREFATVAELIRHHAATRPDAIALIDSAGRLDFAGLDRMMDQVAAGLQRDGVAPGDAIAICAASSVAYAAVFLGALRAGVAVAPLAPSSTPESLVAMAADAGARLVFLDSGVAAALDGLAAAMPGSCIALDDGPGAGRPLSDWLAPADAVPAPVEVQPDWPFNIIYSSGTTGAPKGIVQQHGMRWQHVQRAGAFGYAPGTVTLLSTPLYSNTTLVSFFPAIAQGGAVVLMPKFEVETFLALSERHRVTHTMLVPVQYSRLLASPAFDRHDLSSYQIKFCTSAPFSAGLKKQVLERWPGGLVEFYGMTEGGGTCMLIAHAFPDKLHTVGQPAPGHDIRLIDDDGNEVPVGEIGEVVGHSGATMRGYHNQPGKTAEAEWWSPDGKRFIRTGDVGRFDAEGFLTLMDRKKDMIISGGFNIYPSDLEAVVHAHPAVADVAVVGVPSEAWGETPVAYVVRRANADASAEDIRGWANTQFGKTQRLAAVVLVDQLPRSAIGKVLKRELRDAYLAALEACSTPSLP